MSAKATGRRAFLSSAGPSVAAFTVAKLAWIAEHEPQSLQQTAYIMLPHDYLTWRATGENVTDRGDASGTGWFDPVANAYRDDLFHAAGTGLGMPLCRQR